MAKKRPAKVSRAKKKAVKPSRHLASRSAPRGWTTVERSTKADALVSSSADAVSKSLAELKARQFGASGSAGPSA